LNFSRDLPTNQPSEPISSKEPESRANYENAFIHATLCALMLGYTGKKEKNRLFFNILTKSSVPAENFPFCTIDPNESRVPVPDARFVFLCEHYEPLSKQPAFLNVVDIAGLVKGASEGQGLGNAFLSHIKACDGIFHMVRLFDEVDIAHVEGNVDPIRDIEIIHDELRLKDLEMAKKIADDLEKKSRTRK